MIIPTRSLSRKVFQHARRYELRLSCSQFHHNSILLFTAIVGTWQKKRKEKRKKTNGKDSRLRKKARSQLSPFFSLSASRLLSSVGRVVFYG